MWIRLMVEEHDEEIGFFGVVDEQINENNEITYIIREIFYPKHQLVTSGTCEISTQGESDVANWIMDNRCEEDALKLRFWGHSHHTMGTTPSGQDETQAVERMMQKQKYLIRGICNKSNEMSLSFYDYDRLLRFDDIEYEVETDDEEIKIRNHIRELKKVNIPAPTPAYNSQQNFGPGYHNSWTPGGHGYSPPETQVNTTAPVSTPETKPAEVDEKTLQKVTSQEIDDLINNWEKGL